MRMLIHFLLGISLGIACGAGLNMAGSAQASSVERVVLVDSVFPRGLPHAYTEDSCYSSRCVWNARRQGNGTGQSVILTEWHGDFLVQPVSHKRARILQARYCDRPNVTCRGYTD